MIDLNKNGNTDFLKRIESKKIKDIKWLFYTALIFDIIGSCLAVFDHVFGVGLIIGALLIAIIAIIRALKLIHAKMKQTEARIEKLEEEIEFLKEKINNFYLQE